MVSSVDVSILICTYNHEKYIAQAIESILAQQTNYTYEIIIGDDASADSTPEIIRTYAARDSHIIPVLRKENLGTTRNVYDIARRSRGKYVIGLDGDDCFDDVGRIQRQADFLERHPEYSAVCGRCRLIGEDGQLLPYDVRSEKARFWEFDKKEFRWSDFEEWKMPGHISASMGKNYWLRHDARIMYEAHDFVGDRAGVLLFLLEGPICCTEEIVSCYRIRDGSNNFMSSYVSKNLRGQEVRMMHHLEEYAQTRGEQLNLSWIKKQRLVGAVCIWMKDPTEENFEVIRMILDVEDNSAEYMTLAIKTLILKSYYWNTLHEDFPIEVT